MKAEKKVTNIFFLCCLILLRCKEAYSALDHQNEKALVKDFFMLFNLSMKMNKT